MPLNEQLTQVRATPWKLWNELWRWLAYPQIRLLFMSQGVRWGKGWRFHGVPILQRHRGSQITVGPGMQLRSSLRSNPLGPYHPVFITTWTAKAVIDIGRNFSMTGGTLCAATRITIGNDVTVGANTTIVDTDFHPLDPYQRKVNPSGGQTRPILIGDNVFIGMNSIILKGVILGQNSVVGAGSVVTHPVPPSTIVAGNPARAIRTLANEA